MPIVNGALVMTKEMEKNAVWDEKYFAEIKKHMPDALPVLSADQSVGCAPVDPTLWVGGLTAEQLSERMRSLSMNSCASSVDEYVRVSDRMLHAVRSLGLSVGIGFTPDNRWLRNNLHSVLVDLAGRVQALRDNEYERAQQDMVPAEAWERQCVALQEVCAELGRVRARADGVQVQEVVRFSDADRGYLRAAVVALEARGEASTACGLRALLEKGCE